MSNKVVNLTDARLRRMQQARRAFSDPTSRRILSPAEWATAYQLVYPQLDAGCITRRAVEALADIPDWCDQRVYWRPKLSRVGGLLNLPDPYGEDYAACLRHGAQLLKQRYEGHLTEYRARLVTNQRIQLHTESRAYMQLVDSEMPGDFVPEIGSLGLTYAGWSTVDVRTDVQMGSDRWLWNAFVIGNILLVDTQRLNKPGLLGIVGPGDEGDPLGNRPFRFTSAFYFEDSFETEFLLDSHGGPRWGQGVGLRLQI